MESLRIDPATEVLGLRVNLWVSAIVLLIAVTVLTVRRSSRSAEVNGPDDPAVIG